jgi:hypothetical protein
LHDNRRPNDVRSDHVSAVRPNISLFEISACRSRRHHDRRHSSRRLETMDTIKRAQKNPVALTTGSQKLSTLNYSLILSRKAVDDHA